AHNALRFQTTVKGLVPTAETKAAMEERIARVNNQTPPDEQRAGLNNNGVLCDMYIAYIDTVFAHIQECNVDKRDNESWFARLSRNVIAHQEKVDIFLNWSTISL